NDFSKVDTIVFDKTGTLTIGNPEVAERKFYGENTGEALGYLASVERESDHPLAKAVLKDIGETTFTMVEEIEVVKGGGIVATIYGHRLVVGNVALMESENVILSEKARKDVQCFEQNGNFLVLTAVDGELKVLMVIREPIRTSLKQDLQYLKKHVVKNLDVVQGDK